MQEILSLEAWKKRLKNHEALLAPYADRFIQRRSVGQKHPVHDFLFTYYSCSPLKLKQWVPSIHQTLEVQEEMPPWFQGPYFVKDRDRLILNRARFSPAMKGLCEFVIELSQQIESRPGRFGCFGLHEWAMCYELSPEQVRHSGYELRLSPPEIKAFVDSQKLLCTHYDAYRFFTKTATPMNKFTPNLDTRLEMEQSGCVHANMDIYKWAVKLWPWIGSDFIQKAFILALEGRELDMKASPYDLRQDGYTPIPIETAQGRELYQQSQISYSNKSKLLRQELLNSCKRILSIINR